MQQNEDEPCSTTCKTSDSGSALLSNVMLTNSQGIEVLKKEELESAISPIASSDSGSRQKLDITDTPVSALDVKGVVRKCISENKIWKENVFVNKRDLTCETAESSRLRQSHSRHNEPVKEEEMFEKPGVKRSFESVDTSPCQELNYVKKSNAEYKRGCQISEFPANKGTGLTTEIQSLMLCNDGCLCDTSKSKEEVKGFIGNQETVQRLLTPTVAKNLICDLDADCGKDDEKEYMNSSFLGIDDEKPLDVFSADSDLLPEASVTESHLEKELLDLDRSVKDLSFEEPKPEGVLITSPESQDTSKNVEEAHTVQDCKPLPQKKDNDQKHMEETYLDNTVSSPSEKMMEALSLLKKNAVVFRSYNSPINVSNISEPCSMASLDIMDLSPACSGSYPTALTPLQKGRPYLAYQVGKGGD